MIQYLAIPLFAFLDRLGGGGFGFLGAKGWLAEGHKWARRYALPAALFFLNMTLEQFVLCVALSAILSLDLDEIENRNWDEIFLHGFGIAAVLWPLAGLWALLVPAWWLFGVYLSNIGLNGRKLGWHWVETIRGLLIGLVIVL